MSDEESKDPKRPKKRRASGPLPEWRKRLYKTPIIGTLAYVIWPPRSGKATPLRRVLSYSATIVALLGIGMAAYPAIGESYPFFYRVPVEKMIEWSNFLSDMQTNRIQGELEKEFLALDDTSNAGDGDPLTRIEIPKIGVDTIVVQGTSPRALRAGAGHYPSTPLPGENGNVGIAGHRTTYGRPFNKIDALEPGDLITLSTPKAQFTYQVSLDPWITDPWDWSVVKASDDALLTLTACHPKGSAAQRLIVRAKLVKTQSLRTT